jgi:energy-coupling factor transporter transmembrane protein EcfT
MRLLLLLLLLLLLPPSPPPLLLLPLLLLAVVVVAASTWWLWLWRLLLVQALALVLLLLLLLFLRLVSRDALCMSLCGHVLATRTWVRTGVRVRVGYDCVTCARACVMNAAGRVCDHRFMSLFPEKARSRAQLHPPTSNNDRSSRDTSSSNNHSSNSNLISSTSSSSGTFVQQRWPPDRVAAVLGLPGEAALAVAGGQLHRHPDMHNHHHAADSATRL